MEAVRTAERDPRCQHALPRRRRVELRHEMGDRLRRASARPRCSASSRKLLGSELDRGYRSLARDRRRHRLLQPEPAAGRRVREATCTDISPGMVRTLRSNADRLGLTVKTARADAESLPFADSSFDLVLGHAVLHHLPDLRRAFDEFTGCCARAGGSRSRASPRGSATGWRRSPSAPRGWSRRLWRALLRAGRAPGERAQRARRRAARPRARALRRHPRFRARRPRAPCPAGRLRAGHGSRRGARRELVRVVQPRARGHRRARRRADAVAPLRVRRLSRAAAARQPRARVTAAAGDLLQPAADAPASASWSRTRQPPPNLNFRGARPGRQRIPAVPAGARRAPPRADPAAHLRAALQDDDERVHRATSASSGSCGSPTTACGRSDARVRSPRCSSRWRTAG